MGQDKAAGDIVREAAEESVSDGAGATKVPCGDEGSGRTIVYNDAGDSQDIIRSFLQRNRSPLNTPKLGSSNGQSGTQYCYRHQPDRRVRCTRADTALADDLQKVPANTKGSATNLIKSMNQLSEEDQRAIAHIWSIFSAAPPNQRKIILSGILAQSCFPQLSHAAHHIGELLRIDFLSALPPEIAFRVLFYLDASSLCRAAQVCQKWKALADDDVVWHRMCEQHIDRKCTKCGWGLPLLERRRLRAYRKRLEQKKKEQAEAVAVLHCSDTASSTNANGKRPFESPTVEQSRQDSCQPSSEGFRPWKEVYAERCKIERNWRNNVACVSNFEAHSQSVTCLQIDDEDKFDATHAAGSGVMASGSMDGAIKISCLRSGSVVRVLEGHHGPIRCLQFDDAKLLSGSDDQTVRIWDYHTGKCITKLSCHTGSILGLHFDDEFVATASADSTVRLWNFKSKECITLKGHERAVNTVRVISSANMVISGSDDASIKLWDLRTGVCMKTVQAHAGPVEQIIVLPRHGEDDNTLQHKDPNGHPPSNLRVVSGSMDCTIKFWDSDLSNCEKTLFGHLESVNSLVGDSLRVLSASADRCLKLWDAQSGECIRTYSWGNYEFASSIALSDRKLVYGDVDGTIWIHDYGKAAQK